MLPGPVAPPRADLQLVGAFDWLHCRRAGFWEAAVGVGEAVRDGQLLGRVTTLHGVVQEEIRASREGVVLFLTTSAAVSDGGLLLGLGSELASFPAET
jgi:predicted deacylase